MLKVFISFVLFLIDISIAYAQREPYSFLRVIQADLPVYANYPDVVIKGLPSPANHQRNLVRFESSLPLLQFYSNRLIAARLSAGYAVIPIIESNNSPQALSGAGALGVWQLMPNTARKYGLIVDFYQDDRYLISQSTVAAVSHLVYLSSLFNHPVYVLSAYNWGERNVLNLIKQTKNLNSFLNSPKLPAETKDYVQKIYNIWYSLSILDADHALHFYPDVNYFSLDLSSSAYASKVDLIHGYLNPVQTFNAGRLIPTQHFYYFFQSKIGTPVNIRSANFVNCSNESIANYILYVVVSGDSHARIINKFNIIDVNHKKFIYAMKLHPGLVIKVPVIDSAKKYLKEVC